MANRSPGALETHHPVFHEHTPSSEPQSTRTRAGRLRTAMRRVGKVLAPFGLLIAGSLMAILLFKVAFRLIGAKAASAPSWNDRPKRFYAPENSPENRNFAYTRQKAPRAFRIVVIGDSFTYGGKGQFDDSFSARLERMLNPNAKQPKVEVLNWGVPGYSTSSEAHLVRLALDRVDPDRIILEVTLNDAEQQRYKDTMNGDTELWKELRSTWLLQNFRSVEFIGQRIYNARAHAQYKKYHRNLFFNPETWDRFAFATRSIVRHCKRADVPVMAVVFPLLSHPLDERYPFADIHQRLASLYSSLGLKYLDLFPAFRGIPPERLQAIPGVDDHPNEIGHRIAAEQIYSKLVKERLVPEAAVIKRVGRARKPWNLREVTKKLPETPTSAPLP